MPFGKHKGKKMSDVPHGWLLWMYDRGKLSGGSKNIRRGECEYLAVSSRTTEEKSLKI